MILQGHRRSLILAPTSFWSKFRVPFGVDPQCWGLHCRERTLRLTNHEIIFEEFQPMTYVIMVPQRRGWTDGRTYDLP